MSKTSKVGGTKKKVSNGIKLAGLSVAFLFYLMPFILVIINSFKQKKDIIKNPFAIIAEKGLSFENYAKAFSKMNYTRAFTNSLLITGAATIIVIFLSSMCAYYIVRSRSKFSNLIYGLMIASMIIPFQSLMIPLVSIYGAKLNLLNHRWMLVYMHVGFAMSMSVFMYSGFIKSGIPIFLEEAAYLDGCTKFQTFTKIVFPLLKPTTSTLIILNVLAFWNDYLLPSLVLGKKELFTLPLSTYAFYGTYSADFGTIMAALVLTLAPILILYLFLQKQIISGVVAGAVK